MNITRTAYQCDEFDCFVCEVEAERDPMNPGVYLWPGGARHKAPPSTGPHEAARWVGDDWVVVPDFRGVTGWGPDGEQFFIHEPGIVPPEGWTRERPSLPAAGAGDVPSSVSRFQARAALMLEGLLDEVEAYIARPDVDPLAKLAWREATEFRRKSLTVVMLSSVLGLTEADLDRLFIKAASIVV